MNALVGFGAPWAVALWGAALLASAGWLALEGARGRPVTVTSYAVFFWFVLPILAQYPFTFSPLNVVFSTGPGPYDVYVPHLDRALLASVTGMLAFVAGRVLTSHRPRAFAPVQLVRYGISGWTSSALVWLSVVAVAVLLAPFAAMSLGGQTGGAEGARAVAMELPAVRPIYHVVATVLPVLLALVIFMALEQRRRLMWVMAALVLALAMLTGSRSAAFTGVLVAVLTVLAHRGLRREVSGRMQLRYALLAVPTILLILYLGEIRHGRFNPLTTVVNFGALTFYGNNFSDLRDFAWIHGYWNGELFLGRTQLAGLLGFVPSVLSSFRAEWGWGRITTSITGLSYGEVDTTHAGLRAGMFGESYFNFGFAGVIAAGLALGWMCARLDAHAQLAGVEEPERGRSETRLTLLSVFVTLLLLQHFFITAAFFTVYVTLGVLAMVRVVRVVLRAAIAGHAAMARPA
jgi:hypothetical protein